MCFVQVFEDVVDILDPELQLGSEDGTDMVSVSKHSSHLHEFSFLASEMDGNNIEKSTIGSIFACE